MRGVFYHFASFERLASALEAGEDDQELDLPVAEGLRDGEWVLATIQAEDECTSVAACAVDRGSGLKLSFAPRDWERLFDFAHRAGPPSAPPSHLAPLAQLEPTNARVLLVDDDSDLQAVVCSVLRAAGFAVEAVSSAEEALDWLRGQAVDLLLLDWHLPGLSGIELCRRLRSETQTATLPVLFLSSYNSPEEVAAALQAGANDFVGKPFRAPELGARILGLLRRSQQQPTPQRASLGPSSA